MERQGVAKVEKASTGNKHAHSRSARTTGHSLLELQRSVGNQAIQRLTNSPFIQTKLQISAPEDESEQEADRVADTVMRMPEDEIVAPKSKSRIPLAVREDDEEEKPLVQRACAECEEEEMVQRESGTHAATPKLTNSVAADIHAMNGGGSPLPATTRAFFEPRFGADFSQVRVHMDSRAAETANSIQAKAFTVGTNIAFGPGQYAPESGAGRQLLAHELTHVVQQNGAAIQRAPEDELEAEEEKQYRQDERGDKRRDKMKRQRGEAARAPTPEKVSGDAKKNIDRMIKEAQESRQTGSGRTTDSPKQQKLTNEFRRYLDQYRASEIDQIDEKLKTTPKGPERDALVNQKRAIVKERVDFQYKFDEALRTPKGADVQGKYVRGAPAQPYHDIDDPRRGGYAQPDYTISKPTADGTVVVHVNLKSHDLRDIKAADARQIAKDVTNQAVSNVTGNQKKRGPQLGHLPPTDKLVISFIDMPPEEIRREMNAIILSKDSPIHEVRYGTVTETNPHIKALPKPSVGSSGGPDTKLPKGSVFEQKGSPAGKSIPETSLPKDSVFNIKTPPDAPIIPSDKPTSIRKGRVTVDFDPKVPTNKVKSMRIDMSDMPPVPKSGGAGEMASNMIFLISMATTLAGLYGEAKGGETQKNIEKVIAPIKSYFRGKLEDARVEFHTNYPDPTFLKQASGLTELRAAYEKAMKGTQIGQAQRAWLAFAIGVSAGKIPDEDLKKMAEAYNSSRWAPTGAQLDVLETARQNYEDAMIKVLMQVERYDQKLLISYADDVSRRGSILLDAGTSLESTFYDLMTTVGMIPLVYYELWPLYDKANLFKELGSGMNIFAGEIRQRAREYEEAITVLNNTLIEVGATRFKGLYREPPK